LTQFTLPQNAQAYVTTVKDISKKKRKNSILLKINAMKKNTTNGNSTNGIYLKNNAHFEWVGFPDILYLKVENSYCTVYAKSNQYIYSASLEEVAAQLPKNLFIQVHSNYIVNINAVSGFEGNLLYVGDHKIPVSKTYREVASSFFRNI